MKYIRIAVDGVVSLEEPTGDFASFEATRYLFGDDPIEQVRFGIPYSDPPTMYLWHDMGESFPLVMLVNEVGLLRSLPINARATMLYRCGERHEGTIHGDALICLLQRDMIEGDTWADIPDQFAEPEFWTYSTRVR